MQENWFKSWFNTPYYHTLYKHRDHQEAEKFISNLMQFLAPKSDAKFLDIACGKGRHAYQINQLGFDTIGYDLSEESIKDAIKMESSKLHFYVHDMRSLFRTHYFDYAFNLFTSFGYFNSSRDEQNAVLSAAKSLKKNGVLVIDFLNRDKVINTLVPFEEKTIDNIHFNIKRSIQDNKVVKEISFLADGNQHLFTESVKLLSLNDFKNYLQKAHLEITEVFGNYELSLHDQNSDRLIIVAKKID